MQNSRARLFLPFNALQGLDEALREKEQLMLIATAPRTTKIKDIPLCKIVEVIFKHQGKIAKVRGMVAHIDAEGIIIVRRKIYFKDIIALS